MKTHKLALIFLLVLIGFGACLPTGTATAQSFDSMPETRNGKHPFSDFNYELYLRRTDVNTRFVPTYGGFTFNAKFRFEHYEKGYRGWHFENPTLGDMFWVVGALLKGKKTDNDDGSEQAFGSGFFGWHQTTWNVIATDNFLVSPGLSFGDYIFASRRAGGYTHDPAGYFFYAGPTVIVTKLFSESLWLDTFIRYDLTTRAGKPSGAYTAIENYKNPHFLALGASVKHGKSHLVGGINYTTIIDRGPSNDSGSRVDISVGFMF